MKRTESFVIPIASEQLWIPNVSDIRKHVLLCILQTRAIFLSQIELVVFERKTLTFLAFSTYWCIVTRTRFFMSVFHFYFQMESEVCIVKKRFLETKESERLLKENVRVQQDKSRQLLAACLYKIKETESYVEKVRPFPLSIFKQTQDER